MPSIIQFTAASLSEYFQIVRIISSASGRSKNLPLWYRGHESDWGYQLLPSLFRGNEREDFAGNKRNTYSRNHLEEEYRYQHFRAKGSHLLAAQVDNSLEWKELMQHHFVHSRLMDWSESAMSSLQFALEAYLKPDNDIAIQEKRRLMSPVIWVLDPYKLNEETFRILISAKNGDHYPYIEQALRGLLSSRRDIVQTARALGRALTGAEGEKYIHRLSNPNVGTVVCLSAIMELLREKGDRLKRAVTSMEINPLFYLLSRFYNDGLVVQDCVLPPLAVVHPYHSHRIQAQRGVFTVFPHSEMTAKEYSLFLSSHKRVDPRAMENNATAAPCLYKIRLTRPAQIAHELFLSGGRDASLYPELEYFAKDIEASAYYF